MDYKELTDRIDGRYELIKDTYVYVKVEDKDADWVEKMSGKGGVFIFDDSEIDYMLSDINDMWRLGAYKIIINNTAIRFILRPTYSGFGYHITAEDISYEGPFYRFDLTKDELVDIIIKLLYKMGYFYLIG